MAFFERDARDRRGKGTQTRNTQQHKRERRGGGTGEKERSSDQARARSNQSLTFCSSTYSPRHRQRNEAYSALLQRLLPRRLANPALVRHVTASGDVECQYGAA